MQALISLVTSWPQFVPHAQPLIKSLAERALGQNSSQDGTKRFIVCFSHSARVSICQIRILAFPGSVCCTRAKINETYLFLVL